LIILFTFDREIDRRRDLTANAEYVVSARKVTEFHLRAIGDRDQVPIRIKQLEIDSLVSVVLVNHRVESVTSK
jgi:hypothetical protein